MDFSLISNTFITIFTTDVFFYCILGVVAGMVIGTLPGLSMSLGDYSIFLTRPITVVLLILTVLSLVLPAIGQLRKKSKAAK